jgi:hypothetical protein
MSLSLLITINILADIALLAGLAHVMSHAARLTPHVRSTDAAQPPAGQPTAARRRYSPAPRSARGELAWIHGAAAGHAGPHTPAADQS